MADSFLEEALRLLRGRMDHEELTEKHAAELAALADADADALPQRSIESVEWTDPCGHRIRYALREGQLWRSEDGQEDPNPAGKLLYIGGRPPCVCDERGYGGEVVGGDPVISKLRLLATKAGIHHDLPSVGAPYLRTHDRQRRRQRLANAVKASVKPGDRPETDLAPEALALQLQALMATHDDLGAARRQARREQNEAMAQQQRSHSCTVFRGTSGRRKLGATTCRACSGDSRQRPARRENQALLSSCVRRGRLLSCRVLPLADGNVTNAVAAARSLAAAGSHPNVAGVVAVERQAGSLRIFVEHSPQGTLRERLRRGRIPSNEVAGIVSDLCTGLAHLHRSMLAHGALRTGCILLPDPAQGKGAQLLPPVFCPEEASTRDPVWLSPEQLQGRTETPTPATDIWALGCLVMELVTRKPPWSHIGTARVVAASVARTGKSLPLPKLPRRVAEFVARCLQSRSADRPTPEELLQDPWLAAAAAAQLVGSDGAAASPIDVSGVLWEVDATQEPLPPELSGVRQAYRYDGEAWWTPGPGSSVLVRGGSAPPLSLVVRHGVVQGSIVLEPQPGLVISAPLSSPGPVAVMPPSDGAAYQWMVRRSTRHPGACSFECATRPGVWLATQDGQLTAAAGCASEEFAASSAFRLEGPPETPPLPPDLPNTPALAAPQCVSPEVGQLNRSLERGRPASLCPESLGIAPRPAATPLSAARTTPKSSRARANTMPPPTPPTMPQPCSPPPSAPAVPSSTRRLPETQSVMSPLTRGSQQKHQVPMSPGRARAGTQVPMSPGRACAASPRTRARTTMAQSSPLVGGGRSATSPHLPQPIRRPSDPGLGGLGGRSATWSPHIPQTQGSGRSATSPHPPRQATVSSPVSAVQKLEQRMKGIEQLVEQGQDDVVRRVAQQVAQLLGVVKSQPSHAW
eukprot:Hpha_TRINITY_DN7602_c0_g1::TRINITY_DN7602_c0_g1_i1::g.19357::m.19357